MEFKEMFTVNLNRGFSAAQWIGGDAYVGALVFRPEIADRQCHIRLIATITVLFQSIFCTAFVYSNKNKGNNFFIPKFFKIL